MLAIKRGTWLTFELQTKRRNLSHIVQWRRALRKVPYARCKRNSNQLDLFVWAESARRLPDRETPAVSDLRRRGYGPSTARLLAELAGYPREVN